MKSKIIHIARYVALIVLGVVWMTGCGGDGGGSGGNSGGSDNPSQLTVESVQMGLPVSIADDEGAINGTVYPRNACEMFITLDSSNPTGQMSIWMKVNVSEVTISHYDWEIVDWQSQGFYGELSYYDEIIDVDSELGIYKVRSTNDYLRYDCAVNSAISDNHVELVKVTAWNQEGYFTTAYFKLRIVSNRRLFVVGDSISGIYRWPAKLPALTGRHTFTQAIGGSRSPSMVSRAQGVELAYPNLGEDGIRSGVVRVRWHRHIADRTHSESYRTKWAEYAKAVSEPDAIEVYQGGQFVGLAHRSVKAVSTDYEDNQKRIYCTGHELNEGDRVVFISNDPNWPSDLAATDRSEWRFSSSTLPSSIIERRVYFAVNVAPDSFELKEYSSDIETLDLGSDSLGNNYIECGWSCDIDYLGGAWDVTWRSRTKYDDLIWLLEVSANDIPVYPVSSVTIPNIEKLLMQMGDDNHRFVLVCPPSGSYSSRGPGSFCWTNYYDTYMPWVQATYPNNYIDTMEVLDFMRIQAELNMLNNPSVPELLWIKGDPMDESAWAASTEAFAGATQMWVGPGCIPLQFRASFSDHIHLNSLGDQVLAEEIWAFLAEKGW